MCSDVSSGPLFCHVYKPLMCVRALACVHACVRALACVRACVRACALCLFACLLVFFVGVRIRVRTRIRACRAMHVCGYVYAKYNWISYPPCPLRLLPASPLPCPPLSCDAYLHSFSLV